MLAGLPLRAQDSSPSPSPDEKKKEKEKVTLLDGNTLFGRVEMTDDYTLRITSDSGLMKIPVALLGEKDFKKYTSDKDRSKDGRLWSERKDALEEADQKQDGREQENEKGQKPAGDNAFEIQLKEIAVFQPAIDAYEKMLSSKKTEKSEKEKGDKDRETARAGQEDPPFIPLFSQPNGTLPAGLNAIGGYVEPITSIGGNALDATGGAAVGLPSAPSIPTP